MIVSVLGFSLVCLALFVVMIGIASLGLALFVILKDRLFPVDASAHIGQQSSRAQLNHGVAHPPAHNPNFYNGCSFLVLVILSHRIRTLFSKI
ncbi:unnamed protein product [Anisakis simplex]|uniref:Secreted protein n=1 Tax=Anisakis simplex TaxID=6269 RepID=A0A0M3JGJ4_ANISI|nr:unnamed protein product [Anisakis simplex]